MSAQQIPARAQRLYALWGKLPDHPLTESEFLAAIARALDRGPGAEADVSAFRHALCGSQAVIATRNGDGGITYQKAPEFPTWPENGPGSPAYDAQLRELAEEEQRQHDRVAAEALRNSPQNQQREELDAHIRQVVREELREAIRAELPVLIRSQINQAEVRERMRARLSKTDDTTA
jgi:hypothetical protein